MKGVASYVKLSLPLRSWAHCPAAWPCSHLGWLLALTVLPAASAGHAGTPHQLAVKATYLSKFAPFVHWPDAAFETPAAPLVICLAGADSFSNRLSALTRDEQANGHPLQIRHIDAIAPEMHCQILYTAAEGADENLHRIAREPVLTVTDGVPGGIIRFVTLRGRVRFVIDQAAAQESNLVISSKLLSLAAEVKK